MFAAGEPVFAAGDPADFAYLVEHGRIGIFAADAPHEMLGEIGPGGLFGELAILDSTLRIAGARALVDSELSIISRELFTERLEATDPIVRMLFDTVLNRVRQRDSLNQKAEVPPSKAGVSKMRLELDLRGALESGAIECVFQPIQSLASGRIAGLESLARWSDPQRGPIPPAKFIELAEETSLIVPIGLYMFESSCRELRALDAACGQHLFVSINVSARQLAEPDFLERAAEIAKAHEVEPTRIKLEITESLAVDPLLARGCVARCRAAGFAVALDDFGTGHSGLQRLLDVEFDVLKLDRAFTENVATDERSRSMISGIAKIAHALNLQMIAEGIENEAQRETLRALDVEFAQGFLIGQPQDTQSLIEQIRADQA